jgi:hypothetical protein
MLIVTCLLLCTACMGASAQRDDRNEGEVKAQEPRYAMSVNARENWVEYVDIIMLKSMPPQFNAVVSVQMPTPGWTLKLDEISNPDAQGRIQVKVTATAPEGIVAQVLATETVNVSLGKIKPGEYLLEMLYRNAGETEYTRRGVVMLSASE